MDILVVGSGGREHALTWKISQSPLAGRVYCAPGNAGTAPIAENVDIGAEDVPALVEFAKAKNIGLTVVGPEAPLCAGLVDAMTDAGLRAFGPTRAAAELEGSKAFMKWVLMAAGIPTARYEKHTKLGTALEALDRFGDRSVVKADGLAAGKGVTVCQTRGEAEAALKEAMEDRRFGDAGATVVIEELLDGEEASMLAFCDGEDIVMMPSSQDHKRIGDGDTGPNTGGMGAYSPAPVVTPELAGWVEEHIMRKLARAMAEAGRPYKGILYAGLMITDAGPKVLEFNCRFGDPECQPILMRMESDIVPVLLACVDGSVGSVDVAWSERTAVCVVMAAGGYPGSYGKGMEITGLDEAGALDNVVVFHAGTKLNGGRVVTSGGRVLGVTATGPGVGEAIDAAYAAVSKIKWDGAYYRKDIGHRALAR